MDIKKIFKIIININFLILGCILLWICFNEFEKYPINSSINLILGIYFLGYSIDELFN